jgi:hypothetical protein
MDQQELKHSKRTAMPAQVQQQQQQLQQQPMQQQGVKPRRQQRRLALLVRQQRRPQQQLLEIWHQATQPPQVDRLLHVLREASAPQPLQQQQQPTTAQCVCRPALCRILCPGLRPTPSHCLCMLSALMACVVCRTWPKQVGIGSFWCLLSRP